MTLDEQKAKLDETIPKNEKISWKRKQKNIEKLVEELVPLEEEIIQLMVRKSKIIDKIIKTRATMVAECIHPTDSLIESADGTYMTCKFCERDISIIEKQS